MAGRGPAPKTSRQRHGAPARGDWVKLEPLAAPVLPELADLPAPELGWQLPTLMLWEAWRADPVTQTWNASDLAYAVDTILLHAIAGMTKPNEVRLRMESLGLTPKGRRDLRLLLPDEAAPELDAEPEAAPKRERPEAV